MILKVTAENFRSYPFLSYTIDGPGLIAVEGYWDGTEDKSNGAGKSSMLPDIVCWAVYGETPDGKRQVCRHGTKRCTVKLELPFVTVERSQDGSGHNNKINVNGMEHRKLADAKQYLGPHFPPKAVFASTLILGQGVGERFSGWKPAERAKALADLLDLTLWTRAREGVMADRLEGGNKGRLTTAMIDSLESQLLGMHVHVKDESIDVDDVRKRIAAVKADYDFGVQKKAEFEAELRENNQKDMQCRTEMAQLGHQLKTIQDEKKLLDGSKCPTCARPWPKSRIQKRKGELVIAEPPLVAKHDELDRYLRSAPGRNHRTQSHLDHHNAGVQKLTLQLQDLQNKLGQAQSFDKQIKQFEDELQKQQAALAASDVEFELLGHLQAAFTEVPIRKIDNVLETMNHHLQTICAQAWDSDFLVQLQSERGLQKGGTKSEIGLVVTNRAGDYAGSSWGQQRQIDISVQLALRAVLLSGWPDGLPLLVCDDVVDVLDEWAKRQLYRNYLLPEAERSAVFVLSPEGAYPIPIPAKVLIGYTSNGESYVRGSSAKTIQFHQRQDA